MTTRVTSAMKLISLLSAAAVLGLGTFALSLSLGRHAVGFYAAAATTLLLLGAVRDYAPRRPLWQPRHPPRRGQARARLRAAETMKLAA